MTDAFFGREGDLARIDELIAAEGTTVTLVGPPGVGKTRLAREVIRRKAALDAVACDLSEARTAEDVTAMLAEQLDVVIDPQSLEELVADALGERGAALVVLDNLEQLVEVAGPLFARLRAAAPAARWLATSRQPLAIAGEWVHDVQPLGLEATDGGDSDAMRMLCDRVHRARGTPVDDREREIVDRIAVRLEGLPLALELAAARIASLGAAAVDARLAQPLAVLTRGPRDQRTLRGAIAWSWQLLAPAERAALAQLSVFRGGFDLAAAEAVIDAGAPALDLVDALRHRSLLHHRPAPDDGGALRFGLYLSIREFAEAELPEPERVAARHAGYFADLVERVHEPARLALERDNLLAAIDRSLETGTPDALAVAARVLLGLIKLVDRMPLEPYLERLEGFLGSGASGDVDPRLRVGVQSAAARCLRRLNRGRIASRLFNDALAVARAIGDRSREAYVRSELGMVAFIENRTAEALAQWAISTELYRALGDDIQLGYTLVREGIALREAGQLDRARERQHTALDLLHSVPTDTFCVLALTELAHLHIELDELDDATRVLAEAETRSASYLSEGAIVSRRGFMHLATGELEAAGTCAARAQVFFHRVGYRRFEAGSRCYAGIIDLARGDLASARRAFESAYAMLRNDRRGEYLCAAWLGYALFLAGDRERAQHRFETLPELGPDDALVIAASILRLPLAGGDVRARAAELAATRDPATGRTAAASSFDVRLALAATDRADRADRSDRIGRAAPAGPSGLRVAADGAAFELAGDRGSLARHRTLRRILLALVDQRLSAPGAALRWEAVFAAGWPNDRAQPDAARNRVKVAISTLRTLGLRDLVLHDGTGYLLDPATPVHVDGAAPPS